MQQLQHQTEAFELHGQVVPLLSWAWEQIHGSVHGSVADSMIPSTSPRKPPLLEGGQGAARKAGHPT